MALKHKKYIYVRRSDGWYVKVRVLKSRSEDDPSRYIVVGPKVREAPATAQIIREEQLPDDVKKKLYEV
ncbi:MAG TPA: cren protein [Ignisphaera sp.]|nr:cren protein [Ignisphaera sp.]